MPPVRRPGACPPPPAWLSDEVFTVTMLLILASSSASRLVRPVESMTGWSATANPTRAPGKAVLENEPRWTTRRWRSSDFSVGRCGPGLTSRYGLSSSDQDVVAGGQVEQFAAGLHGHRGPGRIGVVGHHVEGAGTAAAGALGG